MNVYESNIARSMKSQLQNMDYFVQEEDISDYE